MRVTRTMTTEKQMARARRWLVAGTAMVLSAGGGCLQILGDDATFVLGTGGTGGESGGAGPGGTGGGTGGSGATGGGSTTTASVCSPGETRSCYSGPEETEGVGNCKAGVETCADDGSGWGECQGEVPPKPEDPTVVGDEGCDGYLPGEVLCAGTVAGEDQQIPTAVAVDPTSGDLVVAGSFKGSVQFGDSVLVATAFSDAFVAKFDSFCNPLWAIQFGGSTDETTRGVAVDQAGNIIVVGDANGAIEVGGKTLPPTTFVAKFDGQTGQSVWATGCGGEIGTRVNAVALDANDDVLIAGAVSGTIDCGTGPLSSPSSGEVLVAQLSGANGTAVWANIFGGGTFDTAEAVGIDVDPAGSILIAGTFAGVLSLGGPQLSGKGGEDVFVAKLTSNGTHIWSNSFGGTGKQRAMGIALDKLGATLIVGQFEQVLQLPGASDLTSAGGGYDAFLFKLNSGGQVAWARAFGDDLPQWATGVALDVDGNVIVSGVFEGTIDVGPTPLTAGGNSAVADGFLAKLSGLDGSAYWSKGFGDSSLFASVVSADALGNGVLAVPASHVVDFGAGPMTPRDTDGFIARFGP